MSVRVSVLMAAYKTDPKHLQEAMDGILTQTFKDFEFIILDDCPTDVEVEKIVKSYDDPRIRYFRNDTNLGISDARNKLLEIAEESESEYIFIADHDDIQLPEKLQKMISFLDQHPNVGAVGSWYYQFSDDSEKMELKTLPEDNNAIRLFMMLGYNDFAHSSMIRKCILKDNHIRYKAKYSPAEDVWLWFEIINHTNLYNIPEPLMKYRWFAGNTSNQQKSKLKSSAKTIRNHVKKNFAREVAVCEIVRDKILDHSGLLDKKMKYKKYKKYKNLYKIFLGISIILLLSLIVALKIMRV